MKHSVQQVFPPIDKGDELVGVSMPFKFLVERRWLIASIALAGCLLGAAAALITKPVYEANILLQIDESGGVSKHLMGDLAGIFDLKTAAASEMEVLRSRLVLSRAAESAKLNLTVEPMYFPGIGAWLARRNQQLSEPGFLGRGGYVWGAENAIVSTFNVPKELEGTTFKLTALGNGAYVFTQEDKKIAAEGKVGDPLKIKTSQGEIELQVDRLAANPRATFLLARTPISTAVNTLQNALVIAERGKLSGVVAVTLEGQDPIGITNVLNAIGREYIRQHVDRKTAEVEKSLALLNAQLPDLKQELERSETRYNDLRNNRGTIDLDQEAKSILQQSVLSQTKLVELKQKREELLTRFQNEHPVVEAINQQIKELNRDLAGLNAKIKKMPAVEQDVYRLTRDVQQSKNLFTTVSSTASQLRLSLASQVGSVRLLDNAVLPVKPIKPNRLLMVALAGIVGLFAGVIFVLAKKTLSAKINDPQEIERLLGLTVSARIPYSANQERLEAQMRRKARKVSVLSQNMPSDGTIESLRRFRSSLQFAMHDARNNLIMITGPTPAVGKSFVSANLASVLSLIGKKILLIDADLRTGHLHQYFGLDRSKGLSNALVEDAPLAQILRENVVKNVDFISTGDLPPDPGELLASERFGNLLQVCAANYDFVLIDTAPVLAFSDALLVASHAGAIFNVVRRAVNIMDEIEESVKSLNQAGFFITGIIFNGMMPNRSYYGYRSTSPMRSQPAYQPNRRPPVPVIAATTSSGN
jgi:tyrosine-protein kinase Etk/Wzc